jgi:sulfoxide reductase heme-binding subunit YedZ
MASTQYWRHRLARHLLLAVCAVVVVGVVYGLTPPPDVRHRLSMGSAYAALLFLAVTLWLGPWNILRHNPNPVSFDLRRDVGIWAGLLALLHTAVGLSVHLRGRMWMYFFKGIHPMRIQDTTFGLANYTGLVASLVFLVLLAVSNDVSLRQLGAPRWKSIQQWSYAAFALTIVHGIAYQVIEKRQIAWVIAAGSMIATILIIQFTAFARRSLCDRPDRNHRRPDQPAAD